MALTDENSNGMVMPVAPMGGGNGFGGFGGDFGSWIILFLIFGMFSGWGNGGFDGLYPWMNQSNQINNGFRDQMINTSIQGIQNGITSGFGDVQTALCGGFAGVNASINGAQNAIAQQLYSNQISDLERSFAAQTANTQGMTALQSQLAQCCCDNRLATAQTQALVQSENCADRYEAAQNTAAIINAITGGIQSVKDQLCADKIDAKNDTIAQLRSELLFARGQASQDVQTAAIQTGQRALANEIEQYVAPKAIPSYLVQNPNCCAAYTGCGCGVA